MRLISLIDRRQRMRDRLEASWHGVPMPDDAGEVPVARTKIRTFHEEMKARLRRRGR